MTSEADEQLPGLLAREALDLFGEYQGGGGQALIARAVPVFRAALAAAIRCGARDIAVYHNNLGYALHELAVATDDAASEAEAVRCQRAALDATGPDDEDRAAYLCSLASGLRALYDHTGEAGLLREAVSAASESIGLPGIAPSMATRYAVLGGALEAGYPHESGPAVLTEVITAYRHAASHAELLGDPAAASHWSSAGSWARERHERTGDMDALADGIRFTRKAAAAAEGDTRLGYLSNLGNVLRLRFARADDLEALAESVSASRTALTGSWPGNPDLPRR